MMMDLTYNQAKSKAAALRELGQSEVYVRDDSPPWHIADTCEPGGTHRLDMAVSARFAGTCPDTGLRIRWTFDLEPRTANGASEFVIDVEACRRVTRGLRGEALTAWRSYLSDSSKKVRARGTEYQNAANRQMTTAAILLDLAAA